MPQATLSPPGFPAGDAVAELADPTQVALVNAAIAEITQIATLPEVTLQIIRLVEDPDSSAQDLNKIITNDPALGARILKVVNSAFYGLPGQIGSINRAIVLLGLNAVKNIAIAASLAKLFRGGQICPGFNARDLWQHSIAVATGTRLLAKEADLGLPDEAFLAGLIHDLGIMIEVQARRPKFVAAWAQLESGRAPTLRQAELQTLGATHEQFGAALCKTWKFPSSFIFVTGFHHRPLELAPQHRVLACLVHIADILAAQQKLGCTRSVEFAEVPDNVAKAANLSQATIAKVGQMLPEAVTDAGTVMTD